MDVLDPLVRTSLMQKRQNARDAQRRGKLASFDTSDSVVVVRIDFH